MGKSSLGRVVDPCALDAGAGPRARLSIEVPAAWLAEGVSLVVTTPARLACARCDGGGCDACERSGALRAPSDAGARVVHVSISASPSRRGGLEPAGPGAIASSAGQTLALRILHPFGPEHGVEQLVLELRAGAEPSAGVTRIEPPPQFTMGAERSAAPSSAPKPPVALAEAARTHTPWPVFAAAVVAAVLFALFGR